MNGLFIPEITAEMFRNGCLESIEALMAEGEIYDIDYSPWIPCGERLPEEEVLCCDIDNNIMLGYVFVDMRSESCFSAENENCFMYECVAWMPKPKGYNGGEKE